MDAQSAQPADAKPEPTAKVDPFKLYFDEADQSKRKAIWQKYPELQAAISEANHHHK